MPKSVYEEAWEFAYANNGPYRVPFEAHAKAVVFRAQCHKWRHKIAKAIYEPTGRDPEEYYLYELEVVIEPSEKGFWVTFRRRERIVLPRPNVEVKQFEAPTPTKSSVF